MPSPKKPKPDALDETPNAVFRVYASDGTFTDYPYKRRELPVGLDHAPVHLAIQGWLQRYTLDQVISLWFMAQGVATKKADQYQADVANPDSMVGKSPEYIMEYWRTHTVVNGKVVAKEIDHGEQTAAATTQP